MMNNCSPSEDSILCVERMNHSCYNNHHHHHHHLQHLTSTLVSPSSCPKYTHPSPNTQVFIKTLSGKTMTLLVDLKKDTILSVKEKIYQKTCIPALKQRLIHRQLQLEDHKKLSDYPTIDKDSTFHLVLRLVAGVNTKSGKSRSKKTTPIKTEDGADAISNQITSDNSSTSLTPTTAVVVADLTIPKPDDGTIDASIINTSSTNELVTTSSSSNNNNSTTTPATTRKSRSKSNASTKKSSKKSTSSSSTTEIKVKEEPMEKDNNTIVLASSDLNSIHSSPSENSTSPSSSTIPSSNSNALEAYSDESETDEDDSDSEGGGKGKRSGKNKKRGSYTKRACINCRTAHAACDSGRPCKRCIQLGKADSCRDAERKRTKKRTLNEYENAPVFFPSLDSFIPLLSGLQPAPPLETVQKSDDTSNMSTNSETSEKKIKDEFTPKSTARIKKEKESKRKSKNQSSSTEQKVERMDIMEISQPEKPLNSELAAIFAPDTAHSTFLDMESSPTTEQDVQMFFNDEDISLDKRGGDNLSEAFNTGVVLSPESNNSQIEEVLPSTALALVPNNPDNQQLISILQSYNGTLPFDLTEAISQSNNNEIVKMLLYEYLRQSQELRELKQLVASLQFTLINLNPPQFSPNSSTPLNDISNNTM